MSTDTPPEPLLTDRRTLLSDGYTETLEAVRPNRDRAGAIRVRPATLTRPKGAGYGPRGAVIVLPTGEASIVLTPAQATALADNLIDTLEDQK